ncbi:MAG: hypothetical protein QOI57_2655 [Rubrobacteraceae bacterium]|jgi:hypothetical protein|nr:hypothetical protein [Rubrobacteraceae bacterium]
MKITALIREKKALLVVCMFVISSILLAGCGGGGETTASTPPEPLPTPPSPPVAQEVNCGIGAFNVLNCTNQAGEQFSCSGDSHAVGSPYGCTDPDGNQFDCNVVATRMGGFTLSCARLLQ